MSKLGSTYQVMATNRMTGESWPVRQPKRLPLVPFIGDLVSMLGASQDVENAATQAAWKAGAWSYPSPVKSVAQATVAARWAFMEAAKESPEPGASQGAAYFQSLASSAAYTYDRQGNTPSGVLKLVAARLSKAPYTASKVRKLIGTAQVPAATPKAVAKKSRSSGSRSSATYTPPVEDVPAVAPSAWEQMAAGLPAWAPMAASVVLVGIAGLAFWPRRSTP